MIGTILAVCLMIIATWLIWDIINPMTDEEIESDKKVEEYRKMMMEQNNETDKNR